MPSHEVADALFARLNETELETIFRHGLHEFLVEFIAGNAQFGNTLAADYNFY